MSILETLLQQECPNSMDEDFIILIYKEIKGFLNEKPDRCVLIFPPLNNRRRYFIHKVGELFNVQTFSVGEGVRRLTVVCASKKVEKEVDDENRVMDTIESKKGAVSKPKRARPDKPIYIPPAQRRAQQPQPAKNEKTQQSSKSVHRQKDNKKPTVYNIPEITQKSLLVKPETSTSQLISDNDKDLKLQNRKPDNVNKSMNAEYFIVPESHVICPSSNYIVPSNSHENSEKYIESQKIIIENHTEQIEREDIETQKNISDDNVQEFIDEQISLDIVEIQLTKDIEKSNGIIQSIQDGNDGSVKENNEDFNNKTNRNNILTIESIGVNKDVNNGMASKDNDFNNKPVITESVNKDVNNEGDNKNNNYVNTTNNKENIIECNTDTKDVTNRTENKNNKYVNTETNNKSVAIESMTDNKDVNIGTNNKDIVIVESISDNKGVKNETDNKDANNKSDNKDANNGPDQKDPWNNNDMNKDNDQEEEEFFRASEEINRKNKRIIKQSFNNSDILIISNEEKTCDSLKANNTNGIIPSKIEVPVDSWEDLLDGGKLESDLMLEIIDQVGNVTISPAKEDYSEYKQKTSLEGDHAHVLEIYDFPKEFQTRDLVSIIDSHYNKGNYHIKWVDDNHALGIFSSGFVATEILNISHPMIKLRPMSDASKQSISKAIRYPSAMMPSAVRPQTCTHAARRMVTGALGLKLNNAKEERAKEIKILKEAREKKRRSAKQQDDAWEGNLNSSLE